MQRILLITFGRLAAGPLRAALKLPAIIGDHLVALWYAAVPSRVAARHAWADHPVCPLFSNAGLPVTPFHTDAFALSTKPA